MSKPKREPKAVKALLGRAHTDAYRHSEHGRWLVRSIRAVAEKTRKGQGR